MALWGVNACGARSQSTMFSGEFGSTPPSIVREAMPASGGPGRAPGATPPGL